MSEVKRTSRLSPDDLPPLVILNPKELAAAGETMIVEGVYEGYHEEERTSKDGRKFTSKFYKLKGENNEKIIINHTGQLGYIMDKKLSVKPGEFIKVEYQGKDAIKGLHNFAVDVF